ncbi:putative proteinase inhibitor I3, Kunitz legume [Medicago truncatula]|uniref:Kunitz type trypsin inhibitor / Alpha-fucosidase n=1 Tax=Medicago truncatula TaxID=3880 RepID=A0A396HCZ1_MEDTR|nr:putative proteinase inhibitor I3, Kunitz legume [Medicago truncatula]
MQLINPPQHTKNNIFNYLYTHQANHMKLVLSLTLSFLIFAFITTLSLAFSNDEQVLDTNGNPIVPGGEYYIFPATQDPYKGGLRLAKTGDSKCPVTILQNENITGLPVKFTIQGISNDIIMTEIWKCL